SSAISACRGFPRYESSSIAPTPSASARALNNAVAMHSVSSLRGWVNITKSPGPFSAVETKLVNRSTPFKSGAPLGRITGVRTGSHYKQGFTGPPAKRTRKNSDIDIQLQSSRRQMVVTTDLFGAGNVYPLLMLLIHPWSPEQNSDSHPPGCFFLPAISSFSFSILTDSVGSRPASKHTTPT